MKKLFLLKADFQDIARGEEKKYFCPDCALIEGLLSFYPRLRDEIEVQYLDFPRPRKIVIDLIGEANQSLPVLILDDKTFLNETDDIVRYLVENHHIGKPH